MERVPVSLDERLPGSLFVPLRRRLNAGRGQRFQFTVRALAIVVRPISIARAVRNASLSLV